MSFKSNMCLCCLSTIDIFNIFETHYCKGVGEIDAAATLLKMCYDIEMSTESGYDTICGNCMLKLKESYDFKLKILNNTKNEKQLYLEIEYLDDTHSETETEQINTNEIKGNTTTLKYNDAQKRSTDASNNIIKVDENKKIVSALKRKTNDENSKKNTKKVRFAEEVAIKYYYIEPKKTNKLFKLEPGQTICSICRQSFQTTKGLHEHMHSHYPLHSCDKCGKGFADKLTLTLHKRIHLSGPFVCNICDKVFHKVNTRNNHVWRVHRALDPYVCSQCGQRFRTFHKRLKHLQEDHGQTEPKYPCPYCDKKYFYSGTRSTHIRLSHLGERQYKCTHCAMAFGKRRLLLSHMASKHSDGELKHECDICHKRFYRSITLKYHKKRHEMADQKLHKCNVCGDRFSYKPKLRKHMSTHLFKQEGQANEINTENTIVEIEDQIFDNGNKIVYLEFIE